MESSALELHELEIGLGFRGRKEKEIEVLYVHWPEFCCSEEKMDSHEHKYKTSSSQSTIGWIRRGFRYRAVNCFPLHP